MSTTSPTADSYRARFRTDSCYGMPVSPWPAHADYGAHGASDVAAQLHFAKMSQALQQAQRTALLQHTQYTPFLNVQAANAAPRLLFAGLGEGPPLLSPSPMMMQVPAQMPPLAMQSLPMLLESPPSMPSQQIQKVSISLVAATSSATSISWAAATSSATEERGYPADVPLTTLMIRNLPEALTRERLLTLLDARGLAGRYDFVYMPFDFDTNKNLKHAFINMCTLADVERVWKQFDGCSLASTAGLPTQSVCSVAWNDKVQGLAALLERYRNSPVMHSSIPDQFKPVYLRSGVIHQFPAPTQAIKAPKFRKRA